MANSAIDYRDFDGEEQLATRGAPVGDEPTDDAWRAWEPARSKLAAMVTGDLPIDLQADQRVLYLGAAAGRTASHVADFARVVYAVEFAPRPMWELLSVAAERQSLIPLLKDARNPETYAHVVESDLDLLVQDVATREQGRVALENRQFLAEDGHLALAIKARSEDVTAPPETVFENVLSTVAEGYEIEARQRLDPTHEAHLAVLATPR